MPNIPLIILPENYDWKVVGPLLEKKLGHSIVRPAFWELSHDPRIASRELYQNLREFSQHGHDLILISRHERQIGEDWKGIWNRLEKAKTLEFSDSLTWLE
jgi:hypothetical protein